MEKNYAIVAAKEDNLQRTLIVNEEFNTKELEAQKLQHENNVHQALKAKEGFHDKKLEEYSEKMEFLLNELMKNKEAQAHHEEVLAQQI